MARRGFVGISQAVSQFPGPSWAWACSAEMPFEWLVIMWTSSNRFRSGTLERCITVPAVTEVCRWQAAHPRVDRLQDSAHPFRPEQVGRFKPSGHRVST